MKTDRKTKFWIVLFAALFLLGIGSFLALRNMTQPGKFARVYLDGSELRLIDLYSADPPYEFIIESPQGENTVLVEFGKISVIHADCPDQTCVRQGSISNAGAVIVCLPHRLVIEILEGVSP